MDIGRPIRIGTLERTRSPVPARARLRLAADHGSVADARDAVRTALRREGWDGEGVELVVLAVCEAVTNAVVHGSAPGDPVEIEIAATAARARIRVIDRGRPGAAPLLGIPAPPPPSSEHGRGLIIMSALAEGLEIRSAGRGTEVRLEFRCAVPHDARTRAATPEPLPA